MARPTAEGISYFSHDCDMSNDEKIEKLEHRFGLTGYAIYNKILEKVYRSNGEFYICEKEDIELYAKKWKVKPQLLKNILEHFKTLEIFPQDSFVSRSVFSRLEKINKEREEKRLKYHKIKETKEFRSAETPRNPDETPRNEGEIIISGNKGKESKEKESKEKESIINTPTDFLDKLFISEWGRQIESIPERMLFEKLQAEYGEHELKYAFKEAFRYKKCNQPYVLKILSQRKIDQAAKKSIEEAKQKKIELEKNFTPWVKGTLVIKDEPIPQAGELTKKEKFNQRILGGMK